MFLVADINQAQSLTSVPAAFRYSWTTESDMKQALLSKRSSLPPAVSFSSSKLQSIPFGDPAVAEPLSQPIPQSRSYEEKIEPRSVPQRKPVEYILVLEKPIPAPIPPISDKISPLSSEEPKRPEPEETPPSVRNLRSRFEFSNSVVPEVEPAKMEKISVETGSLRQKLKELSDAYKDPVANPCVQIWRPESNPPKLVPKASLTSKPPAQKSPVRISASASDSGENLPNVSLKVSQMRQLFQPPNQSISQREKSS